MRISKFLFKDQSRAFANVEFEWFGLKVVPEIGLHRSSSMNEESLIETIRRWIDESWIPYNYYNR
jgi:hypothetical protein